MIARSLGHGYFRVTIEEASASLVNPQPHVQSALVVRHGDQFTVIKGNLIASTRELVRAIGG